MFFPIPHCGKSIAIDKAYQAKIHIQDYVFTDGSAEKSVERKFAESLELRPIEKAKISCARKLFNEISTENVVYHDVSSYEELLNVMNAPELDKKRQESL